MTYTYDSKDKYIFMVYYSSINRLSSVNLLEDHIKDIVFSNN